ncbi:nucleotidyltransferase family protein [bacterium]
MIDLAPEYLTQVKIILIENIPMHEVRIFGSRVNGTAQKNSDIDLVIIGKDTINWREIEKLKDIFSESDIPYIVDIVDWHSLDDNFRKIISSRFETIQKPF